MRIALFSDIHLESAGWVPPALDCDLVICAGNIGYQTQGVEWAKDRFTQPVLYVPGALEFFGGKLEYVPKQLKQATKGSNVKLLSDKATTVNDFRFIGATLWTDYRLLGNHLQSASLATTNMPEFRNIKKDRPRGTVKITPDDLTKCHRKSLKFISKAIKDAVKEDKTPIVITHHAPLAASLPKNFRENLLSPAYASDLSALIKELQPKLWLHGSTGYGTEYRFHKTRIVSNPRYSATEGELADFKQNFILEI